MKSNLHMYVMAAPLLTAFLVNIFGRNNRKVIAPLVLGALGLSSLLAIAVLKRTLVSGDLSYTAGAWTPPWGIELLVDPLSALMLLLISAVSFLATFAALPCVKRDLQDRQHLFFTLYLILIAGLMGLVLTADAFNVYVMLEITSITTYGLIALGRGRAPLSSFNYIIMGSVAASFYLLGVGYLYLLTGTLNMADIARYLPALQGSAALATALAFILIGLWIKMAFFPLHGWLPRAYSDAPDGAGVLIAPLMTKVTIYLMIRLMLTFQSPEFPLISMDVRTLVIWAAAIGIICASSLALAQRNLKQMLTYIIIAEVGYMVGGAWLANDQGTTGALLHIVNDALMTLCLFLAAVAIAYRTGSLHFDNLRGLYRRMPWTMAFFTVGAFAMIGVPPTCGFYSKWYLLLGGIEAGQWEFVVALIFSSLVNAVLFFRIIELAYFGSLQDSEHHGHASSERQEAPWWILSPLALTAVLLIAVGLSTGPLVNNIIRLMIPVGF
jgi:multicomponent Na+:H+ antiporter subunit D